MVIIFLSYQTVQEIKIVVHSSVVSPDCNLTVHTIPRDPRLNYPGCEGKKTIIRNRYKQHTIQNNTITILICNVGNTKQYNISYG